MRIKSCEIEKPFPADFGVGIRFENEDGIFETVFRERERHVCFHTYSYVGTTLGAVHVYGALQIYELEFKVLKSNVKYYKKGEVVNISGAFEKPEKVKGFTIEIVKKLTAKEIEKHPRRWENYYPGDMTDCFHTTSALKSATRQVFKKWFVKCKSRRNIEWKLIWR